VSMVYMQAVIGRAVVDSAFREQLKTNPAAVLDARQLTDEEKDALKNMNWDAVASVGTDLDQRVSRMVLHAAGCQ